MDSTDSQESSAESLLYIFPAPIFSSPQRNRPCHGYGQSATALWPIVAESHGGFHRRDHYVFRQTVSLSILSTTPEPRPCEPIFSPNYQLAMS